MADGAQTQPPRSTKRLTLAVGALALAAGAGGGFGVSKLTTPAPEVHFSPPQGGNAVLVRTIRTAEKEIVVQAYIFSSWTIRDALIEARQQKPNMKIMVILDRSMLDQSMAVARELLQYGIPVRIDGAHEGCAHNKVIVIDESLVVTGSFNLTWAAETKNAENLVLIPDASLAKKYRTN